MGCLKGMSVHSEAGLDLGVWRAGRRFPGLTLVNGMVVMAD